MTDQEGDTSARDVLDGAVAVQIQEHDALEVVVSTTASPDGVEVANVSLTIEPLAPASTPSSDQRRSRHETLRGFAREPLERLRPHTARVSAALSKRPSFRRKVLRANTRVVDTGAHLKLDSFRSHQVSVLVIVAKLVLFVGPILQVLWTVWIEPDHPPPAAQQFFTVRLYDGAEAAIQLIVIISTGFFVREVIAYPKRQRLQAVLANLAACFAIVSTITLASDVLQSVRPYAGVGRRVLSFANALLANVLVFTLSYLTDHFAETILSSREAFQHARQERLLLRSRRLSFALNVLCGFSLAVRLVLTWRSAVVFDFLPMTNIITPIRMKYLEHKDVVEPHVLVDALVLSIMDGLLLLVAAVKSYITRRLFRHIFISDFARQYTEFAVFVVSFRNTVAAITLSSHVAAWIVPFAHTINTESLTQPRVPIIRVGAVDMQFGFRVSLALWLASVLYCALPANTRLIPCRTSKPLSVSHDRIKYFVSQAEALQKTAFRNLRHAGHVDARAFILEHHIEAFNFAQLVYARGNRRYDQDLSALQALVGDPSYAIVDVVHDVGTDTHGLILASSEKIVVTFRGTSSQKNAQTDLQSAMTTHRTAVHVDGATVSQDTRARTLWHKLACKLNDPKVHAGFYGAYCSVADRVLECVCRLYTASKRPVVVTGHSLGGALAVLCAFDLVARCETSNVACTTFGCPRIGNHAFQKRYARIVPATFAFVHASDMITKLPPKTPKAQSYASVGQVVLMNAYGNLILDPNRLELDVLHSGYSPRAHAMRSYQLALLRWCLRSHTSAYHPQFWRQSLAFLQADFGHVADVRDYLKTAMSQNLPMRMSLTDASSIQSTVRTRTQLRAIARRLESALQQEREDRDAEAMALSLVAQIRQWFTRSDAREWFSTDDALRLLMVHLQLRSDAAAMDVAQLLTVQGLLKPKCVVLTRRGRVSFPLVDGEDEDEELGDGDAAAAVPLVSDR